MPYQPDAKALEFLYALSRGAAVRRSNDRWHGPEIVATAAQVAAVAGAGLVHIEADALLLTPAGRDLARRPNRLLVEQPLARDRAATSSMASRSVTVNRLESPLGWLHARGLIDRRRFDAGERLRGDWTMAGLGPRVTMRWEASSGGGGRRGPDAALDPTLAGIAAKRRFDDAIEAAGKGLSDVLWRVVCAGEGLEAAEGALGWPKRAGKLVLLMALDRVADYYRIA